MITNLDVDVREIVANSQNITEVFVGDDRAWPYNGEVPDPFYMTYSSAKLYDLPTNASRKGKFNFPNVGGAVQLSFSYWSITPEFGSTVEKFIKAAWVNYSGNSKTINIQRDATGDSFDATLSTASFEDASEYCTISVYNPISASILVDGETYLITFLT